VVSDAVVLDDSEGVTDRDGVANAVLVDVGARDGVGVIDLPDGEGLTDGDAVSLFVTEPVTL